MMLSSRNRSQQGIFGYLVLLTLFFVLVEISFFVLCNKAYLSDFRFMVNQLHIPPSIVPAILVFVGAQALVHFAYCFAVWFIAVYSGYLFKLNADRKFKIAMLVWCVGMIAVFAANQHWFPNSRFTELTSLIFFDEAMADHAFTVFSFLFISAFAISCIGFLIWIADKSANYIMMLLLSIVVSAWVIWVSLGLLNPLPEPVIAKGSSQPNIFIIGVDSLRPDFLSYFGAEQATPFMDKLLGESTVFTEAVTPLARTFPSWVGILTGQYPRESGVRFNLASVNHFDFASTLPSRLKKAGYQTIYATDETRFSNIDQQFGFDQVISPPIGLNDFLLGSFNDFPLSNLVINTSIGRWLFPYSFANRPAFVTYDPDSFIALMKPALRQSHQQPLFMAVHFCLPHYPYLWAGLAGNQYSPQERYRESVMRVDRQIGSFIGLLQSENLLEHAIVVLLSDHGEALEFSGDRITARENFLGKADKAGQPPRFYPPSLDEEAVNQSAGHGTDVLGIPQYHTLLAFKLFGMGEQHKGDVAGVVSLKDIKPALLALSGTEQQSSTLANIIRGNMTKLPVQHVFMESDYSPESIRTVYPETRKVLLEGIQLFQIDPQSSRLTVKDTMGEMIIRSKQYADIYDHWMLALYPQESKQYTTILINLQTGKWTNNLHSKFARQSPAMHMLAAMNRFYGSDLGYVVN